MLLGVFLHSALGGNATLVTQIGKSTDRFLFILYSEFNNLKLPHHDLIEHMPYCSTDTLLR